MVQKGVKTGNAKHSIVIFVLWGGRTGGELRALPKKGPRILVEKGKKEWGGAVTACFCSAGPRCCEAPGRERRRGFR